MCIIRKLWTDQESGEDPKWWSLFIFSQKNRSDEKFENSWHWDGDYRKYMKRVNGRCKINSLMRSPLKACAMVLKSLAFARPRCAELKANMQNIFFCERNAPRTDHTECTISKHVHIQKMHAYFLSGCMYTRVYRWKCVYICLSLCIDCVCTFSDVCSPGSEVRMHAYINL